MKAWRWLLLLLGLSLAAPAWAQPPPNEAEQPPAPKDEDAPPDDAPREGDAPSEAGARDAEQPAADPAAAGQPDGETAPPDDTAKPAAPTPAPKPAATKKRSLEPKGAIVLVEQVAAKSHAKALARAIYADALLRPAIDEHMAQVLVGAPPVSDEEREVASVVATIATLSDDSVRRRLLSSLAVDLGAQLVVMVRRDDNGASARVLRMPDERFVALRLVPNDAGDWRDAVGILRGLVSGPPPGPHSKPAGGSPAKAPEAEDDDSDWDLLTSPWFWGGLGVVVTVGVTVLVLSQTALNEPDVVMLEGRIGP